MLRRAPNCKNGFSKSLGLGMAMAKYSIELFLMHSLLTNVSSLACLRGCIIP